MYISFLWKYQNSKLKVFKPVDDCNDLIYSNDEFLSIGGKYVINIIINFIYIYIYIYLIILNI